MDRDADTDPFASFFRPTDKHRFAGLVWPTWDQGVFDREMQASDDGHELAFVAGNTYVRRVLSLERPKKLSELLDKATLNFIGRWGISGFLVTRNEVLSQVEGNYELLASFQSGVMFALDKLRNADIPESVSPDVLKELLDALEADGHDQFVSMAELGPGISERQRAGEISQRFNDMQTGYGDKEKSSGDLEVVEEEGVSDAEENLGRGAIVHGDEPSEDEEHENREDVQVVLIVEEEINQENQEQRSENEGEGHVALLFGEDDDKNEDNSQEVGDQMKDLLQKKVDKNEEVEEDARSDSTIWIARRGKRVRSQKWIDAQKAKRKAKRDQKRADGAEGHD